MLPSGIHIAIRTASSPEGQTGQHRVAASHESWARDTVAFGPWQDDARSGFLSSKSVPEDVRFPVVIVDECHSSMDEVFALVEKDILPEWGSVIAVSQDCGRGQLRRAWKSPPGNVYGSLRLPNHSSRLDLWGDCMDGLIPLVAGYVFCVALEQMGAQVRLKWPNDFVFRERKVGGMLIEERGDVRVLGVGINLASCPDESEMRKDTALKAGCLCTSDRPNTPLGVWKSLVNRGENIYTALIDAFSPSEFISLAEDRLAWIGRKVIVHEGGDYSYQARIKGLSPEGRLVLERNGKECVLSSGSILPA